MNSETINFVTTGKLIPPNSGDRVSTLNMLVSLAKDFKINLICIMQENDYTEDELKVFPPAITVQTYKEIMNNTGIITFLRTLFLLQPYSHAVRRNRAKISEFISNNLNSDSLTIWNHYRSIAYYKKNGNKNVLIQHNNESKILILRSKRTGNILTKIFCVFQSYLIKLHEYFLFKNLDRIIYESNFDKKKFDNKSVLLSYLPIKFSNSKIILGNKENIRLLFVGSLDWYPNSDGILWFIKNVFNNLPEKFELVIVGRNPSDALLRKIKKDKNERIKIYSNVLSVEPFYESSDIFIAPILTGAGINIKILEAASFGIPIVSTKFALRGYYETDFIFSCDHADEFQKILLELGSDYKMRQVYQNDIISFYNGYIHNSEVELKKFSELINSL